MSPLFHLLASNVCSWATAIVLWGLTAHIHRAVTHGYRNRQASADVFNAYLPYPNVVFSALSDTVKLKGMNSVVHDCAAAS